MLDAVRQLPAEHRPSPALYVLDSHRPHSVGPDGDALEKGAGGVEARLADGEHGVEVDVWLDKGGRQQRAAEVDDLLRSVFCRRDQPAADTDFGKRSRARQADTLEEQVKHSLDRNLSSGSLVGARRTGPQSAEAVTCATQLALP